MDRIRTLNASISSEIDDLRKLRIEARLKKVLEKKSSIENEIWQIRKRIIPKKEPKLAVKSKEGKLLTDTREIQHRYQEYYKDLLQNRQVCEEYKNHAGEVDSIFELNMKNKEHDEEELNHLFSIEELECVIKQMKRNKCPGNDDVASEIIMNAGKELKKNMLDMYNWFFKNEVLPEDLTKIIIKSLYKGKGETTELKNHRGIFISSAILKMYEKLSMNRITPKMEEEGFSEYQAGARKHHSIQDQLFILYSLIDQAKYLNQKLYLEFLDLVKAFDKMVLRCVLNDLWRMNIRGRIWRNIYQIKPTSSS